MRYAKEKQKKAQKTLFFMNLSSFLLNDGLSLMADINYQVIFSSMEIMARRKEGRE